ncbi:MAG: ABC transporter permease subunit [Defluviitaleaceae bacterium]|nr:ABC transporter permease subunit [Defluviitaleaceae bacterium]
MKALFYVWVFISCAPLLVLAVMTVSTFWPYPALLPEIMSWEYYYHVFVQNDQTLNAAVTSILLAVSVAFITLMIAVPAAKALTHHNFFGKDFVKILVLLPIIVPGIAVTIGNQISMIRLGLTGTFGGVAIIHSLFALPFAIRIMSNVFEAVGNRLELQAAVLGAGPAFIFRRVTLPQIIPGLLAAFTLSFTISIAQYVTTFMIGGGRVITLTILLVPHIQGGQTHIAAVYSVLLIGAAVLSLSMMEHIVRRYYNFENVFYA